MANNKQVKIGIGFDVDKNGLKELKNIQNQLINIASWGNQAKGTDEFTKGLKEAGQTASKLYDILEKSYSANLGTVNVTKFKQELDKAGISVKTMKQDLAKAGAQGNAAFASLGSALLNTNVQLKKSNSLLDEMATTMANTVKWGVTSSIFNNISSSVQDAYHYVKQLDSSLNDIRIVTDKSAESMAKFAVQANTAAKNLGASTRDYTDASLIYYQQGLSDKEVAARAETTLKTANVTGQNTAEVSEQLTAVWNGYKVSAEEAELYIDKLAAVAATTASDLEELSTGMSKVASAANLMGIDIDQLNAQLATIVSVTRQAPESVGTALKTIYARMGDIEAGVDTETTLGNYTKEMEAMGFNVLDANGNLRDMGAIIEEIGAKWTTLSREQQIALSQTMAGTRQYNNLLSLFDNWDMYTDALNTSAEAAGTLQHQQDIYMETTEAHLQQLKTSAEDVYDTLIKTEEINVIIDIFKNGTDVLGSFFDAFGGGIKSMAAGAIILSSVFSKQIGGGLINFQKNKYREQSNLDVVNMKKELVQKKIDETGNETIEDSAAIAKYKAEANCAEKILKLKNGITNEDYEQLTSIQAKIGALTEEVELHKKIAEQKKKEFEEQYGEGFDFNDIGGRTDELIEELKNKKITLQNLQNESDVPSGNIEEQEIAILEEKISLLQQIQEENDAAQSAERQRSAQETDFDMMRENAEEAAALNNSITAITSSMTALFSVWGAINSLGSIWSNEDLSTGEKLVQTFITLGAVLPMVTMAMKKFKDAMGDTTGFGASFDKVWGTLINKLIGTSAAAGGAATGAAGLKAALSSLGGTLSSLAATVLPVVAVVGVLAAAFIAVYNEATKYERAVKKASEAHESIKASAEEAKTSVENLKNAFEEYSTVTDTLNQCVKGTNEWNDALEKANNQVLTMLNQFPELLKMEGAITRNAEGLLEISKSAEAQIKADADKRKETLEAAELLSGVDVTKAQNEYDASSIIKGNSFFAAAEDWAQVNVVGINPVGEVAAQTVETFNFYDEASSILLNDIDKLTGLTETELESQLRESLGGLKETYNISDLAFDDMIESLRGAQEEIEKLGQNASEADIALENIGNTLAAENLQGYSDAVQEIASESFEKNYLDIKDEVMSQGKDDVAAWSREATNKDVRDLWARYNEARGTNFSLAKNAVQGTDDNRTFHYKNKEGKEQSVTLEQMASTIATSEALQKMGASAAEAVKALTNLQTEVGNTDIYEGLENFIATKGSFGSMNRREFEQLQNSVNEAGGVEDYLNSIGINDETATQYGFEDIDSLISAFESGIKNMDFDGLTDTMYKPVQDAYEQQMNNISTLSFDARASLINSINQAYEVAGQKGLNSFTNIFNKMEASGEAEEFAKALNSIDWSTANVENVEKALKNAGIETALTVDEIRGLISSMDSTGTSISELNKAFAAMKDILDGLATGSSITKEEFNKIGSTLGEEFQGYFAPMLDGTYKLIGAAEDFKEAVNQSLLDSALESKGQLGEKINRDQAFVDRGWEDLSKTRTLSSDSDYVQDQAGVNAQLDFLKEYGSDTSLPTRTWRIGLEEGSLTQEDLGAIAEAVAACEGAYGNLENELATTQEQFNQLDMSIALSKTNLEDLKASLQNGEISGQAYTQAAYQMDLEQDTDSLDTEEWDAYAEHLQEIAKDSDDLSDSLEGNEDAAKIVAKGIMKMNDAIETLSKNFDDWNEILSDDSAKATEEYADAMDEARGTVADLLDVSKDFVSDDFVAEHLEEIGRAAEGDAETIDSLKNALADDVMGKILLDNSDFITNKEEVLNQYNALKASMPDVKAGVTLDGTDSFVAGLNELISSTGMTVDQVNALCDGLGFEAAYETEPTTYEQKVPLTTTYHTASPVTTGPDGEKSWTETETSKTEYVDATGVYSAFAMDVATSGGKPSPKISGLTKKASGASANKGSSPKKGGGGGGSKGKKADKIKDFFKDDVDIYHEINTQLEILQNNYDKLAKAQEKLTGKALIDNLKAQTDAINDQIEALKTKRQIAEQEARTIKKQELDTTNDLQEQYNNLTKKQKKSKKGKNLKKKLNESKKKDLYSGNLYIQYTDQGTIANYDEVLRSEQAAIQKLEKKYNKGGLTEKEKEKLEKAKANYEELKSSMNNYDELMSQTIADIDQQMRDLYDQKIEIQIETLDSKLQLRLDSTQLERDYNDFLKEINEDDDNGIVEDMKINKSSMQTYESDIENTKKQLAEAQAAYETISKGGIDATFGDNAAAALEKVKEYQKLLTEQLLDYKEVQEEVHEQYLDLLDSMNEQFDEQYEAYERINDELEYLGNLQSKILGEQSYDEMNKILNGQIKNSQAQIDAKKKELDAQKKIRDAAKEGSEEWKKANERILQAEADIRSLTESTIDAALTRYENRINKIFDDAEKKAANMSFEDADKEWESFATYDSEFLDDINRAYGVNDFKDRAQDAINSTNSIRAQEMLNALKDDELNKLKEKNKLTQYDVDRANKMLDITLKQIALEEAQNNKSKMRLRRDSQGNYSYQYVADNDQVDKLQDELDKAKNELYNFDKAEYKENIQKVKNQYAMMQEELKELMLSEDYKQADKETQAQMVNSVTSRHEGIIQGLVESNNRIRTNIGQSALDEALAEGVISQQEYDNMTVEQKENFMNNLLGIWDSGYQNIANLLNGEGGFSTQVSTMLTSSNEAVGEFQTTVNGVLENTGEKVKDWATLISDETSSLTGEDGAITKVNTAFNEILTTFMGKEGKGGLVAAAQSVMTEIANMTTKFTEMQTAAENAAKAAKDAIKASNEAGAGAAETETNKNTTENSTPPAPSESNKENSGTSTSSYMNGKLEKGDRITLAKKANIYKYNSKTKKFADTKKDAAKNKEFNVADVKKVGDTEYAKISSKDNKWIKKGAIDKSSFDTGGYTGDWNSSEGRLALLHQKELVLNAKDTENMLKMLDVSRSMTAVMNSVSDKVRNIISQVDKINSINNLKAHTEQQKQEIEQRVHIEATFPNVSQSREIEDAFNNLINIAAQRAYNTKRLK